MISGGNFSLNDVVVKVSDDVPGLIEVPVAGIEVCEENDASTNLEPEHVGWKVRWIKVVDELQWIYVLLIHTLTDLADLLITRDLLHHVAIPHLCSIIGWCDDGCACQAHMVMVVGIKVMKDKLQWSNSLEDPRFNSSGKCTMYYLMSSMMDRILSLTLPR